MIIKMQITFDYNPETNEYTPIKQEIIKEKQSKIKQVEEESTEPEIKLLESKLSLNKASIDLLGLEVGDKVEIKYHVIDKIRYPIIGKNDFWASNNGNKLTKSNTISCRGTANTLLAEFGTSFKLNKWDDHSGLYIMVGDKERFEIDDNISIEESFEEETDKKSESNFNFDEIGVDNSDFEDLEEDNFELNNFNFNFD